jgi:hypothetical protein
VTDKGKRIGSQKYRELIGEALVDKTLRNRVKTDPVAVAKEWGLAAAETETLRKIDQGKLADAAASLGGETTADIKVVIGGTFSKSPSSE